MNKRSCIIGSGPAGIAAASALLKRDATVFLLDGGMALEEERLESLEKTSRSPSAEWDEEDIDLFKEGMNVSASGLPVKLTYGSDYPYREAERLFTSQSKAVGIVPSLARGGFSTVWGAAMMPYLPEDTPDWAVKIGDLAEHYKAVIKLTGLAGRDDNLSERFPLYGEAHDRLPFGSHVRRFLGDLELNEEKLRNAGVLFGQSRLAVARQNAFGFECSACAMCLYGCPSRLIFNAGDSLPELQKNDRFTYRSNIIVEKFSETENGVTIFARDSLSGEPLTFEADRLLIGAGVLSTTRLVLESMQAYNEEVIMKDSQYFLLPLLRYSATKKAEAEAQHTLAQAFIEIFDDKVSDKSIHLQVYGYNEFYRQAVESKLSPFHTLTEPFINSFLRRFILIQGYLHSDYSHSISIRLNKPAEKNNIGKLSMELRRNPQTDKTLKKLIKKLTALRSLTRAIPLQPLLKKGDVGRGFHTGGSFPMREKPQKFETDTLGRLPNWSKIHLIDASVFPSIPANTITLTAMANAHRIASEIEI